MASTYIFAQKPALEDLQHFGVPGMKWGVRNKQSKVGKSGTKREELTLKQKKIIGKSSVAVGLGAAFVAIRKSNRTILAPFSSIIGIATAVVTINAVNNSLNKYGGKKIKTLNKKEAS